MREKRAEMGQNRRREPRHDLTPTSGNTASVSFNQRASRKKNPDAEPSSKKVAGLEPAQSHAHHSLSLRVKYIFLVAPLFSACTLAFTTWIKLVLFPAGKIRIHTELLLWSRALLPWPLCILTGLHTCSYSSVCLAQTGLAYLSRIAVIHWWIWNIWAFCKLQGLRCIWNY